jgi:hypothetical protein
MKSVLVRSGSRARRREVVKLLDEALKQSLSLLRLKHEFSLELAIWHIHINTHTAIRIHKGFRILVPLSVWLAKRLVQNTLRRVQPDVARWIFEIDTCYLIGAVALALEQRNSLPGRKCRRNSVLLRFSSHREVSCPAISRLYTWI